MKKFIGLAMSTIMVTSLLAGCSSDDTDASADGGNSDGTTIKWAIWDYEATPYYDVMIDGYKEENPDVTIEVVDLGSADYSNMVQTQLAGNADFDVVTIKDNPSYANLISQNQLEPLDDYIAENNIDPELYGGVLEQLTFEDTLYQLPFRNDFWLIYYNKDLYDEVGVDYPTNDMTIDEYDELARSLVHGEGNDKVYGAYYQTWRSPVQLFAILDGKHTIIDGTYDWMAPTYEMVLSEQDDGIVMDYSTALSTSSHYRDLFYNAKMAMMNIGSWQIASQISAVKDGTTDVDNWGIVKYPHPEGVEPGTTIGITTGLSVSSKSENKEEALDFIRWASSEEGAKAIATTGTIPAIHNENVMETISSLDGFPQDQNSIDALQTSKVYLEMPMHENAGDIELVLYEEHSEIMSESKSIEEGLAAMEERVAPFIN